jgi:hypothetical protein
VKQNLAVFVFSFLSPDRFRGDDVKTIAFILKCILCLCMSFVPTSAIVAVMANIVFSVHLDWIHRYFQQMHRRSHHLH